MASPSDLPPPTPASVEAPTLDAATRLRLGRRLQALYDPVLDESLDPRLAELIGQLEQDRRGEPSA